MKRHFRGDFREHRARDGENPVSPSSANPLEFARQRLGWSYRRLGATVGASHVAAFRWCRGLRPAPLAVYIALGLPVPTREPQTGAEEHRPRVTVSLPKGCDEQTALEACVRAVAQALNERRGEHTS